jgi:hypothetical protein
MMFPGFTAGASLGSNRVLAMASGGFLTGCLAKCVFKPCNCWPDTEPCGTFCQDQLDECVNGCVFLSIFID